MLGISVRTRYELLKEKAKYSMDSSYVVICSWPLSSSWAMEKLQLLQPWGNSDMLSVASALLTEDICVTDK